MKKKIYILDGNSIAHRAYHSMRPLTTKDGFATNAIYGFMKMLLRIIKDESPDGLVVAFDIGKTFRHELYPEYKGTRKPMEPELREQFPVLREMLTAMGVTVLTKEGYEADDILGTLSVLEKNKGYEVFVVTADRDMLQLIDENVTVLLNKKGMSVIEAVGLKELEENYGLKPGQIKDMKGLQGDASDNIKGVFGIGEKTALKLIQEYGCLENIYENIDELKGKVKANLEEYKEDAFFSRMLATIECNVPLEEQDYAYGCALGNLDELEDILEKLEFKSLGQEIFQVIGGDCLRKEEESIDIDLKVPMVFEDISLFEQALTKLDTTLTMIYYQLSKDLEIEELHLFTGQEAFYFKTELPMGKITKSLVEAIALKKGCFVFYQTKEWFHLMLRDAGEEVLASFEDLSLMNYMVHPEVKPSLENLLEYFMGGSGEKDYYTQNMRHIFEILKHKVEELGVESVYRDIEKPLAYILAKMEYHGIGLDKDTLDAMDRETKEKLDILETDIYSLTGQIFNISSPKQLGKVLFEDLGLKAAKKTKTGYSTKQEVLEKLAAEHAVIPLLLEYRKLSKLYNTYIKGLLGLIDNSRIIHTTFNQTVAVTGRLSSENPNLQNIPIRLPEGRLIRKAFVPTNRENFLLCADYSQVELRILAHISGDENLINAFKTGEDIHTRTASEVFGAPLEEVTKTMRSNAKAVNFGIVYGISEFSLSKDLGITVAEAKDYIEKYFARYPKVRAWIDQTLIKAHETLKVTTLTGRFRTLPELNSSNFMVRSGAERMAMNAPIQGTAADLIKIAMIKVDQALEAGDFKSKMLLQVHDELIFEVPEKEIEEVVSLVKKEMNNAMQLSVPLKVDVKIGHNWYDMEGK